MGLRLNQFSYRYQKNVVENNVKRNDTVTDWVDRMIHGWSHGWSHGCDAVGDCCFDANSTSRGNFCLFESNLASRLRLASQLNWHDTRLAVANAFFVLSGSITRSAWTVVRED
jgi:hypothetical protein